MRICDFTLPAGIFNVSGELISLLEEVMSAQQLSPSAQAFERGSCSWSCSRMRDRQLALWDVL